MSIGLHVDFNTSLKPHVNVNRTARRPQPHLLNHSPMSTAVHVDFNHICYSNKVHQIRPQGPKKHPCPKFVKGKVPSNWNKDENEPAPNCSLTKTKTKKNQERWKVKQ